MKLYRYERTRIYSDALFNNLDVELFEFEVLKETPKGYWVIDNKIQFKKTFVLKSENARKRFAYETKEKALNNFIKRTEKCIKIYEDKLKISKIFLTKANKIKIDG